MKTYTIQNQQIHFSGIRMPREKALFGFDLDGSLAHGTSEEIAEIMAIAQEKTATPIYATGQHIEGVVKLQTKLSTKSITLPTPEHIVTNNGQFIFTPAGDSFSKNTEYESQLREQTNFDSERVFDFMKNFANTGEYKFSPEEMERLKSFDNYGEVKTRDPLFFDSKITHYKWNASEFMSEYFVAAGVNIERLKAQIQRGLATIGIKTKFVENRYPETIMNACNESILAQSNPLRRHNDGSMTALFLCPADKADGIKYLQHKLDISDGEILTAGNDDNDVSMANLVKNGSHFVCLNNSSPLLRQTAEALSKSHDTLFISQQNGAAGILDGIKNILSRYQ